LHGAQPCKRVPPPIMKFSILSLSLLAVVLLRPVASAQDVPNAQTQSSPTPAAQAPEKEKKTELELRMGRIGKAYRKLRKQVSDPSQNAASLELIATIQAAAQEAVQFTPAKAEDLPEDQRAKFTADFKAGINKLQDLFAKLKDAISADKNDEAVKIVADISALEKEDHKQFKRPDKD